MEHHTNRPRVGTFRAIRIVRPSGDPDAQARGLIESDAVSTRYVVIHFDSEATAAYALFDAIDRFVLDKKNAPHASKMPLGIIKITRDTLHVVRNYVRGGESGPVVPIIQVGHEEEKDEALLMKLVYGADTPDAHAGNKYILLYTLFDDRGEAIESEDFITRLDEELYSAYRNCPHCAFDAHPLGLFVYNNDVLACFSNYVAAAINTA